MVLFYIDLGVSVAGWQSNDGDQLPRPHPPTTERDRNALNKANVVGAAHDTILIEGRSVDAAGEVDDP